MQPLFRVIRSASALWPYYVGIVVISSVTAALHLVSPFIIREATDTIVEGKDLDPIVWLAVALFAAYSANTLMQNIGEYLGDVVSARIRQTLSTRYFAKLLSLPQSYFDGQVTGTIIARLDRSIMNITQTVQTFSNTLLPMLLQVIAILGITAFFYWPLTLLLLALFPIYLALTAMTSKRWQKYEKDKNEQIDLANGRFAEVVGQVKVTKSFVSETRELQAFSDHYGKTIDLTRPQSRWWHGMDVARGMAMNAVFLGIYLILFVQTYNGRFSIGDMVMLIQLVTMAQQPVQMMSWLVDSAQRAIAGSRDYFKVMDRPIEDSANPQVVSATNSADVPALDTTPTQPLPAAEPTIRFDNVSFSYDDEEPVLSDISFSARHGEKIALVGESGGGKSTLVNLILGLYPINHGSLTICGKDIDTADIERVRASVGVVFQEPALFSGTIRENIAYGNPNASDDEIIEVAKRANAHTFISGFADGYNTVIGERGLRLSGGQKQRVAVARAMLKDAPLLVLDEATSALDTKSERAVQAGLDELMKDRTTIMIAHRLSTIASVDTIITLKDGKIDEIGTPSELAVSGGIYSELLALTASSSAQDRKRLKAFGFKA